MPSLCSIFRICTTDAYMTILVTGILLLNLELLKAKENLALSESLRGAREDASDISAGPLQQPAAQCAVWAMQSCHGTQQIKAAINQVTALISADHMEPVDLSYLIIWLVAKSCTSAAIYIVLFDCRLKSAQHLCPALTS